MVLMSADEAAKRGLAPLGRIAAWSHVGVDPEVMGIAPVNAVRTAVGSSLLETVMFVLTNFSLRFTASLDDIKQIHVMVNNLPVDTL